MNTDQNDKWEEEDRSSKSDVANPPGRSDFVSDGAGWQRTINHRMEASFHPQLLQEQMEA
ncbi:MAG TPA: hypothetical protein VFF68_05940 [Anaerolineaceae bacterium]|nr:hypothetical protein [Anaerolineaceae bacterium]